MYSTNAISKEHSLHNLLYVGNRYVGKHLHILDFVLEYLDNQKFDFTQVYKS